MYTMDQVHRIRELYFGQGKNLTEIAEIMGCDWRTVRKYVDKEDFSPEAPKAEARQPSKLSESEDCEISCEYILSRKKGPLFRNYPEKYRWLHPQRSFDFIAPEDRDSIYTLSFRLVKITLDNGMYEYLITNLPEKRFSIIDLKELYKIRWKIETSFLFLKYGIALNYFHSIIRDFISQEIFARLILFNFISLIISCIEVQASDTKYSYQISISDAIYKCRLFLIKRMQNIAFIDLLLSDKTPVRPDRTFKRNMQSQRLKSLQNRT